MEGFGSVQIITDPIHEAQKHLDPTATDPDHGSGRLIIFAVFLICNSFIIFIFVLYLKQQLPVPVSVT
jgi:hypothetical protein